MKRINGNNLMRLSAIFFYFLIWQSTAEITLPLDNMLGNLLQSSKEIPLSVFKHNDNKNKLNTHSLLQNALKTLKLSEHQQHLTIKQSFNSSEFPNHVIIEILQENLLDDAIKSVYYALEYQKEKNSNNLIVPWRMISAQQAFLCRRSTLQKYAKVTCS